MDGNRTPSHSKTYSHILTTCTTSAQVRPHHQNTTALSQQISRLPVPQNVSLMPRLCLPLLPHIFSSILYLTFWRTIAVGNKTICTYFIIYIIVFSKLELVCLYNHISPENGPAYCAHVPQFEVFIRFLKFPICLSENSIFIMRICAAKLGIIYSINCCHLYTFITMMRKLMQCSFLTFIVFSNNIF